MAGRKATSKKRSGASSRSEPQPSAVPVFFLDRDLGKYDVAGALRGIGAKVEIHADHFEPQTPDTEWLPEVGRRGWVVLTRDRHILTRALEVVALLQANTHAFVLRSKSELTGAEMAAAFKAAYRDMCQLIAKHEPPFLAQVTATGHVAKIEGYKKIVDRIQKHAANGA